MQMFLALPFYDVYISHLIPFVRVYLNVSDFNNGNQFRLKDALICHITLVDSIDLLKTAFSIFRQHSIMSYGSVFYEFKRLKYRLKLTCLTFTHQ